uniref:Gustatory receptor n=1 Tax=Rhabditophanes sp. KR3021 TaxID=114890 RepID=A0AC35TSY9_9BILA
MEETTRNYIIKPTIIETSVSDEICQIESLDGDEPNEKNGTKLLIDQFVSIALVLIATIPSLALRVVEVMAVDGQLYSSFFVNISYCLVPLLTLWNVLPLLYFEICNRLVRFWCRTLVKNIENENKFRKFNIRFYYIQFLKITKVQRLIGRVFNPFIFFSMAFSLLLVVFAIYFLTQQNNSLFEPLSSIQVRNETFRDYLTLKVKFTLGWATLQIFIALLYICVICYTGLRTNEQTRKVVKSILELVPVVDCESDRFQVQCFIHKMQTQYIWGMSLWKILPLERNTFFTIVSVIITYSVMLLKIKENETVPAVIFKNVTIT